MGDGVAVVEVLRASLGSDVVVDYATNSGKPAYAKGRLISVEPDSMTSSVKIVVSNHKRLWIIDVSRVLNFVVDKQDVEAV